MDDTSRTALSAGSLVSGSLRLPLPLALSRACDPRAFSWQPSGHHKRDCRMRREISLKPLLRSRWRSEPRWVYCRHERLGSAFCEARELRSSCGRSSNTRKCFSASLASVLPCLWRLWAWRGVGELSKGGARCERVRNGLGGGGSTCPPAGARGAPPPHPMVVVVCLRSGLSYSLDCCD